MHIGSAIQGQLVYEAGLGRLTGTAASDEGDCAMEFEEFTCWDCWHVGCEMVLMGGKETQETTIALRADGKFDTTV